MGDHIHMVLEGDWEEFDQGLMEVLTLPEVHLGVALPDEQHPAGPQRGSEKTYLEVAMIVEHGDDASGEGRIPPRPVFGPAAWKHEAEYADLVREALTLATHGKDWKGHLEALAERMVADVRHEIDTFTVPVLADSTIRKKGHDQVWVETGHIYNDMEGEVAIGAKGYDSRANRFRDSRGRFRRVRGVE